MTMIISAGNRDQVVLAVDRRLSANGKAVDEKYNKAIVINAPNGRFGVGFTGIAKWGQKNRDTQTILNKLIFSALNELDGNVHLLPDKISEKLNQYFKNDPHLRRIGSSQKCLTVYLSGYVTTISPPLLVSAMISNYQDFVSRVDHMEALPEFTVFYEYEKSNPRPENPAFIQRFGQWRLMSNEDENAIRTALKDRVPGKAIEEICVGVIRKISDKSNDTVGKDVSIINIPSDPSMPPTLYIYYHNSQVELESTDAIIYSAQNKKTLVIKNVKISVVDNTEKIFPAKIPRNSRCHCKSGLKYKYCCGKPR